MVPSTVTLWEVWTTSGKPVTCVLSTTPRTATLSIAIGGVDIVVERFPLETEARRYARTLYLDFKSQGCVDTSKRDA
jgi:hypothetical protein